MLVLLLGLVSLLVRQPAVGWRRRRSRRIRPRLLLLLLRRRRRMAPPLCWLPLPALMLWRRRPRGSPRPCLCLLRRGQLPLPAVRLRLRRLELLRLARRRRVVLLRWLLGNQPSTAVVRGCLPRLLLSLLLPWLLLGQWRCVAAVSAPQVGWCAPSWP